MHVLSDNEVEVCAHSVIYNSPGKNQISIRPIARPIHPSKTIFCKSSISQRAALDSSAFVRK